MITHTSLDAFEERARTGAVTTKVDADLRMIVALVKLARETRAFMDEHDALVEQAKKPGGVPMAEVGERLADARASLKVALASVPR